MGVYISKLGDTYFLVVDRSHAIPIASIVSIGLDTYSHHVVIETPEETFTFIDRAEEIRKLIAANIHIV